MLLVLAAILLIAGALSLRLDREAANIFVSI